MNALQWDLIFTARVALAVVDPRCSSSDSNINSVRAVSDALSGIRFADSASCQHAHSDVDAAATAADGHAHT